MASSREKLDNSPVNTNAKPIRQSGVLDSGTAFDPAARGLAARRTAFADQLIRDVNVISIEKTPARTHILAWAVLKACWQQKLTASPSSAALAPRQILPWVSSSVVQESPLPRLSSCSSSAVSHPHPHPQIPTVIRMHRTVLHNRHLFSPSSSQCSPSPAGPSIWWG
jgi:hypothetical protein